MKCAIVLGRRPAEFHAATPPIRANLKGSTSASAFGALQAPVTMGAERQNLKAPFLLSATETFNVTVGAN
jgi:hypothetical protein